jgi:ATP-binding cassette subfamily B protein
VLFFFPDGQGAKLALLAVLIDLIQKSITPIKEVAGKISSIQRAKTGVERILDFQLHFKQDHVNLKSEIIDLKEFKVRVDYFAYPPREGESAFGLKNIIFSGKPGELIGIVGSSGCGKSTLLRLLSGQHGPFQGIINLNNISLSMEKNADLFQLCQQVSLVSQDSHVFSASVRFNVALSEDSLEFDEFWQKALKALPYLRRWGIEPQSVIDPKTLSLGQKQLISGLRACYLRKPIVLFDEVSSGLDPDLERALRDLVLFVQQHSLTIIVTHRVETILSAQKLVVMERGELVDLGTPGELSQRSELFKDFLKHLEE